MSTDYVYSNFKTSKVEAVDGSNTFIHGAEVNATFRLNIGQYTVVVFTDSPADCFRYVISFQHSDATSVLVRSFNTEHEAIVKVLR